VKGEEWPGLSMTRALGDLCVKDCGVIAEPEVHRWAWPDHPGAVVLAASDGVWEFLSTQQVSKIVLGALERGLSHRSAADELLKEARRCWEVWDDVYCDDITAVLASVPGAKELGRNTSSCCVGVSHSCVAQ